MGFVSLAPKVQVELEDSNVEPPHSKEDSNHAPTGHLEDAGEFHATNSSSTMHTDGSPGALPQTPATSTVHTDGSAPAELLQSSAISTMHKADAPVELPQIPSTTMLPQKGWRSESASPVNHPGSFGGWMDGRIMSRREKGTPVRRLWVKHPTNHRGNETDVIDQG